MIMLPGNKYFVSAANLKPFQENHPNPFSQILHSFHIRMHNYLR